MRGWVSVHVTATLVANWSYVAFKVACILSRGFPDSSKYYAFQPLIASPPKPFIFVYCRYVATRLGLWRGKGRDRLQNLFAKMGISLDAARQTWTAIQGISYDFLCILFPSKNISFLIFNLLCRQGSDRKYIGEQLAKYAKDYKLENYYFRSFVSHSEYRMQLSASDVSYAVNGLLANSMALSSDKENKTFYNALDSLSPSSSVAQADLLMVNSVLFCTLAPHSIHLNVHLNVQ